MTHLDIRSWWRSATVATACVALLVAAVGSSVNAAAPDNKPPRLEGTWRTIAESPFAVTSGSGGWTGTELIVADGENGKVAAYDPDTDSWRTLPAPPEGFSPYSPALWTGDRLVFVDHGPDPAVYGPDGIVEVDAYDHPMLAYDPATDSWAQLAGIPLADVRDAIWADGTIVATGGDQSAVRYDMATDTWQPLGQVAGPDGQDLAVGATLYWTGTEVLALGYPKGEDGRRAAAVAALDPTTWTWGEVSVSPLSWLSGVPTWMGDRLIALTSNPDQDWGEVNATFDPVTDAWTTIENPCDLSTDGAVWTGSLILNVHTRVAMDPATGQCYTVPRPPDLLPGSPQRLPSRSVEAWTGDELIVWSGNAGEEQPAIPAGAAFAPPAAAEPAATE
jgi:hypothetical protein